MTKNKILKLHKLFVIIPAIIHLALCRLQIDAIYGLQAQSYSPIVMFLSILIGLACLFNATRLSDLKIKSLIVSTIGLVIEIGLLIALIIMYIMGLSTVIDLANVIFGIVISIVAVVTYSLGLAALIFAKQMK